MRDYFAAFFFDDIATFFLFLKPVYLLILRKKNPNLIRGCNASTCCGRGVPSIVFCETLHLRSSILLRGKI